MSHYLAEDLTCVPRERQLAAVLDYYRLIQRDPRYSHSQSTVAGSKAGLFHIPTFQDTVWQLRSTLESLRLVSECCGDGLTYIRHD